MATGHPSVSIWRKQNKLKCFGCNTPPIGPVDLVMNVLQVDLPNAVLWIATEFQVPRIPSGKHLKTPERRIFQFGCESPSELLVRSGVWGKLRPQTQRLVPVLLSFAEQGSDGRLKLQISYRALMRYSGIRSFNSVSGSFRELVEIGWMQALSQSRLHPVARETAVYILTPFGAAFSEFANCTAAELREEIEREREFRRSEKQRRLRWRASADQTSLVKSNVLL